MQLGTRRRWFLGGSLGLAAAVIAVLITFGVPQAQGGCGGGIEPEGELSNEDNEVWNAANNPALKEFEALQDLSSLSKRDDVDVAVICCPWPQYRDVEFSPATKVLSMWQL